MPRESPTSSRLLPWKVSPAGQSMSLALSCITAHSDRARGSQAKTQDLPGLKQIDMTKWQNKLSGPNFLWSTTQKICKAAEVSITNFSMSFSYFMLPVSFAFHFGSKINWVFWAWHSSGEEKIKPPNQALLWSWCPCAHHTLSSIYSPSRCSSKRSLKEVLQPIHRNLIYNNFTPM